MKVGLIGLGNMGGRIARRLLQQGIDLSVYDVKLETCAELTSVGAQIASSPFELASESRVVLTILPDASAVKEVVLGKNGLLEGFAPGSTLIDMTSSVPAATKEVGKLLRGKQVDMLDAPVSGGVKKAETGELSIMVGGNESVFLRCSRILELIGTTVTHVGELGAGHTIKALNNLICAATLGITSEALAIGVKMGLDPSKMLEVINNSSGRSHASEVKFPQQVLNRRFEVGFILDLMYKDVSIALNLAETSNVPAPIAGAVSSLWKKAAELGYGKMDHSAIAKFVENGAGVEIRAVD